MPLLLKLAAPIQALGPTRLLTQLQMVPASTMPPPTPVEQPIGAPDKLMKLTAWTMLMVESTMAAAGTLPQLIPATTLLPSTPTPSNTTIAPLKPLNLAA